MMNKMECYAMYLKVIFYICAWLSKCFVVTDQMRKQSGLGSGQGQFPRGPKLTDRKVLLTDHFDRQLVNFENHVSYILPKSTFN